MSGKVGVGGLIVLSVGVITAIIGLILFFSVFFAGLRGFGPGTGFPGSAGQVPFERAVLGLILTGAGTLIAKVGLGMTVVGYSDRIASWIKRLFGRSEQQNECAEGSIYRNTVCPSCEASVPEGSRFCNRCGARINE